MLKCRYTALRKVSKHSVAGIPEIISVTCRVFPVNVTCKLIGFFTVSNNFWTEGAIFSGEFEALVGVSLISDGATLEGVGLLPKTVTEIFTKRIKKHAACNHRGFKRGE